MKDLYELALSQQNASQIAQHVGFAESGFSGIVFPAGR